MHLICNKPAVINVEVDPDALYSFRKDSFKHRSKVICFLLKKSLIIDSYGNFYQLRLYLRRVIPPSIFIHGVGLDNTMWYPQKEHFHK